VPQCVPAVVYLQAHQPYAGVSKWIKSLPEVTYVYFSAETLLRTASLTCFATALYA
jgi:hypothetical protein